MGFTSWECPCCEHSIRHPGATNNRSAWLADAVVVFPKKGLVSGIYDGFGRIEGQGYRAELNIGDDLAMFHRACWILAGNPGYTKPSESARDQGHFVGDYDPAEPKSGADVAALKEKVAGDVRKAREDRLKLIAELEAKGESVPAWLRG